MSHATLLAIHVGRPTELRFGGRAVHSAIHKGPVNGPVLVRRLNIDGDEQADLSVHGGPDKAVYCYASEHYAAWSKELARPLGFGFFGENLTLAGLREDAIRIGDVLCVGETMLQVSQPRLPCFKLGVRFGDQRFVARFAGSRRSGFYCRVLQEGIVEPGQAIEIISGTAANLTVEESFVNALSSG